MSQKSPSSIPFWGRGIWDSKKFRFTQLSDLILEFGVLCVIPCSPTHPTPYPTRCISWNVYEGSCPWRCFSSPCQKQFLGLLRLTCRENLIRKGPSSGCAWKGSWPHTGIVEVRSLSTGGVVLDAWLRVFHSEISKVKHKFENLNIFKYSFSLSDVSGPLLMI